MPEVADQIKVFMESCDTLIHSNYVFATSRIKSLLQSIADSKELCGIFQNATQNFSYLRAKDVYLAASPDGSTNRRVVILPEDETELIAFVFCLLFEFDRKIMDFNGFLQTYFTSADGSYTESYDRFGNQVIKPFRGAVRNICKAAGLPVPYTENAADERTRQMEELRSLIARLKRELSSLVREEEIRLPMEDILSAMTESLNSGNNATFKALLSGYAFGEQYAEIASDELEKIYDLVEQLDL